MAARDKIESIIRMMDQDNDGEALNALRLLRRMAQKESKNLAEFLLNGAQSKPEPKASGFQYSGGFNFHEAAARAEANRQRNERARAEEARQEQRRREREARKQAERESRRDTYGGMFDDAEMTDEQREAARQRRAERKAKGKSGGFRGGRAHRELLDELAFIAEHADRQTITSQEREFCEDIARKLECDWEMSVKQENWANRIIRKYRQSQDEPII